MEKILFRIVQIVAIVIVLSILLIGVEAPLASVAVPLLIVINVYMLIASRKNMLMLIISFIIAYSNYSIVYANFIGDIDSYYTTIITARTTNISLNILLMFNCLLVLFVRWDKMEDTSNLELLSQNTKGGIIPVALVAMLVFVFFWGFNTPETFGLRGTPKPIYEYSLAFFLVLFYFWGNNKLYRWIGVFLVVIFALQNFIFGGRILGIQFLLCMFFMLYMNRFSKKTVLVSGAILFILMSAIGRLRGALFGGFNLSETLLYIIKGGFALDTAYSAYFTSETFVYCHDVIPIELRLNYLMEFVKGIFFSIKSSYVLQNITGDYILHYNGGIVPHYFYFYLGNLGVFVGAALVSIYLNIMRKVSTNSSGLVKVIAVFAACHTVRWYLYTPLGLLRGVLFVVIVYCAISLIMKEMSIDRIRN